MSPIIVAREVCYELPNGRELFSQLSFSLDRTRVALVGPNGTGKTSLARLIAGEVAPSHGRIARYASIKLLRQRETPHAIAVSEYLSAEYDWSLLRERLLKGIDQKHLCTHLSGGEWMRVRLASALTDDFLILDEPTNDLDRAGRDTVLQFLRERRGGALVISHDRECLELCQKVLELSNRGLSTFGNGWIEYVRARDAERERLSAALDAAKRHRDDTRAAIAEQHERQAKRNRRGAQAGQRGGMAKIVLGARQRQAQATTGKLNAANVTRAKDAVRAAHQAFLEQKIDPVMYADMVDCELPGQKLIVEAIDFNVRFDDWIYPNDLTFLWRGNVRIALRGGNGSGKSTLLQALLGRSLHTRGTLRRGDLVTVYLDQRLSSLDDDKSVLENSRTNSRISEVDLRNSLARFLFAGDSVHVPVRHLSGGERLRAALARAFLSEHKPQLLILDEPTNNLDLANIEFLEGVISRFKGALIVVSHDQHFLKHCNVAEDFTLRG